MNTQSFGRVFRRALGVALALAAVTTVAGAQQTTTGAIRGQITSDGRPVDVADITARNQERGVTFRTQTGADGRYAFVALPVGPYTITVRRIGYQPVERRNIEVHLGETVQLNFALEAAAQQLEAVEITGEAQPLIDTD